MYSQDNADTKDLNSQMMSFFVAKWCQKEDSYIQYSVRMSLENAVKYCKSRREDDPKGDYKVHGELDF